LDIDTLELLEELLQNYAGTVFLVSHDRAFLDNVVTSTIAYEGEGHWREYEGGVQDWLLQSNRAKVWSQKVADLKPADVAKTPSHTLQNSAQSAGKAGTVSPPPAKPAAKKLSFKEQREFDSLPSLIEQLEQEQNELNQALADGSLYASDPQSAADKAKRVGEIDDEMLAAMERLELLSQRTSTV
jgi:ATP-binding cassette subfamily F protein uup